MPVIIQEADATLTPVRAAVHQRELATAERMKRMNDPEGLTRSAEIRCN